MLNIFNSKLNEASASVSDSESEKTGKSETSADFKMGDIVKYKTKEGGEAVGTVKKVDSFTIYNDNIKKEITKDKSEIIGLSEEKNEKSEEKPEEMKKESLKTRIVSYKQFVKK